MYFNLNYCIIELKDDNLLVFLEKFIIPILFEDF